MQRMLFFWTLVFDMILCAKSLIHLKKMETVNGL